MARILAVMMAALAFAGCIGGGSDDGQTECPGEDDASNGDNGAADEAMEAGAPGADGNESSGGDGSAADTRNLILPALRQGQEGNASEDDLPSDNENGEIAESGAAPEDCPPVDEATDDTEQIPEEPVEVETTRVVILEADGQGGDLPYTVTFSGFVEAYAQGEDDLDGDGTPDEYAVDPGAFTWTLSYGDDSTVDVEGNEADMPHESSYTYEVGGTFNAMLDVTFEDGEVLSQQVEIVVTVPEDPVEPPQEYFEYGPTGGCVGDFAVCVGLTLAQNGQGVRTIDGHFQALDERYWGATLNVVLDPADYHDSDCKLLNDAFEVIGEANGGSENCVGTVPDGTAWIFLYPYAVPTLGMELTFTF